MARQALQVRRQVIGIIDVEAWDANHFSDLHIGVILMVCAKLGERNLFV